MTKSFEAIYEHGVFRPLEPVDFAENERVTLTVLSGQSAEGANASPTVPQPSLSDEDFDRLLDDLSSGPALPALPWTGCGFGTPGAANWSGR